MNRRATLVSLLLIVFVAGTGFVLYLQSFQTLKIEYPSGLTDLKTVVYAYEHEDESPADNKKIQKTVTGNTSLRLKRGGYQIVTEATATYKASEQVISVDNEAVTVTLDPDYSEAKNQELLVAERDLIKRTLLEQYPKVESAYSITNENLFLKGTWYGATLQAKPTLGESNNDTIRFIARKTPAGGWQLITSPPDLIISKASYPEIPGTVVDLVNKLSAD